MRDDRGGHGELHGARVDDADNVAGSGGLQDAEEWTVTAVLGVKLDDLLLVSMVLSRFQQFKKKIKLLVPTNQSN